MLVKILVGTLLGFLTGLGIGGGSLLILWLTIIANMDQIDARGINLLFFMPSALIACCFRWKQGTLALQKVFPAVISGVAAAVLFSWIGLQINADALKKGFGVLLILTGLRELCYTPKNT